MTIEHIYEHNEIDGTLKQEVHVQLRSPGQQY